MRASGVVVATIVLAVSATATSMSFASPPTAVPPADQTPTCPQVQVRQESIIPQLDGQPIRVSVSGSATLRTFEGTTIKQLLPPDGWQPLNATADELQVYGLPPRPTEANALSDWEAEWAAPTKFLATSPCITGQSELAQTIPGNNWAGVVADAQTNFTHSYGKVQLPIAGAGTCDPDNNLYSAWAGVGGDALAIPSNDSLLQNGIIASTSVPTGKRGPGGVIGAFWEEINNGHDKFNGPVWTDGPGWISPGDTVSFWTTYNATGVAQYSWHDITTQTLEYMQDDVTAGYYDGRSAEWIDEDNTRGNLDVRSYGQVSWSGVSATAGGTTKNAGDWTHHDYRSISAYGNITQNLANGGAMNNSSSFDVNWVACH